MNSAKVKIVLCLGFAIGVSMLLALLSFRQACADQQFNKNPDGTDQGCLGLSRIALSNKMTASSSWPKSFGLAANPATANKLFGASSDALRLTSIARSA